jgi:PIN domain nuclease of toxin-antitoxin system
LLLDTHILIRWLFDSGKLSRTQLRSLETAVRRGEPEEFFRDLSSNPAFRILPLTYEVALEVASLAALRDPADRTIAATARVHRLRLVTSDQRIIDSKLVPVVE